ncbi:MAG: cobalamin, partial [Verrucomicrobia bacterium]|nr:cobalamin [Verrucomicrobiota bacterium]
DFNEPLLENVLDQSRFNFGPVLVVLLFILPGRHAGPDGDIAQICRRAEAKNPGLRTIRTELLGSHPRLVEVLAKRFREMK